jgi:adenylate kinase
MTSRLTIGAVLGISGVGKTFLIKQLASRRPELSWTSGGTLLERANAITRDDLRLAQKSTIIMNQEIIRRSFVDFVSASEATVILFDGHCVINSGSELVPIPASVFKDLGIDRIAFVYDDPGLIQSRRVSDQSRNRAIQTVEEIAFEQDFARTTCAAIVQELQIPSCQVSNADIERLELFLWNASSGKNSTALID